jgi:hypothetical protein
MAITLSPTGESFDRHAHDAARFWGWQDFATQELVGLAWLRYN